ncbi:unnamed protein product, partial [Linum tenue]
MGYRRSPRGAGGNPCKNPSRGAGGEERRQRKILKKSKRETIQSTELCNSPKEMPLFSLDL